MICKDSHAQKIINLTNQQIISLTTNDVLVLEDTTNGIPYINVISGSLDSLFYKVSNNKFYMEKLNVNYWLKFQKKLSTKYK